MSFLDQHLSKISGLFSGLLSLVFNIDTLSKLIIAVLVGFMTFAGHEFGKWVKGKIKCQSKQ